MFIKGNFYKLSPTINNYYSDIFFIYLNQDDKYYYTLEKEYSYMLLIPKNINDNNILIINVILYPGKKIKSLLYNLLNNKISGNFHELLFSYYLLGNITAHNYNYDKNYNYTLVELDLKDKIKLCI